MNVLDSFSCKGKVALVTGGAPLDEALVSPWMWNRRKGVEK